MAASESEHDFTKELRLMFSNAKGSTEMLRSLLEDAIRAKHGTTKSLGNIPTHKPKGEDEMCIVLDRDSDNSVSENDDDDDEVRALELEMMEEDLSCSVCKEITVGPGNRLMECCECQSLYHQECHKPSIQEKDMDDPRKTWCCSSCKPVPAEVAKPSPTKAAPVAIGHTKSLRSSPSLSAKRDSPTNIKSTSDKSKTDTSALFKRSEKVSPGSGSSSSSSSKPSGLAAMAASLQGSKSSSSSSKSSSGNGKSSSTKSSSSSSGKSSSSSGSSSSGKISSSSGVPSPTSSSAADKRLQNMKKKAATKLQEKRKHSK